MIYLHYCYRDCQIAAGLGRTQGIGIRNLGCFKSMTEIEGSGGATAALVEAIDGLESFLWYELE